MPPIKEEPLFLDSEDLSFALQTGGQLDQACPGFEQRDCQIDLLEAICQTFNKEQVGLFEAGTGTGKSFAYLIPAIVWALQNQEPTLISTNTIPLQEQLLDKDIPLLKKALGLDFKATLIKGMNNYLCLRKLKELKEEEIFLEEREAKQFQELERWAEQTLDGSKSTVGFSPSSQLWEKVAVEKESCSNQQCPFYKECFFFKARKQAQESHLLIANHHLFFRDFLNCYQEDAESSLFSKCRHLIFDEAHNLESVAISQLSFKLTPLELVKTLALLVDKQGHSSILSSLKQQLKLAYFKSEKYFASFQNYAELEIPAQISRLEEACFTFFSQYEQAAQQWQPRSLDETAKLRLSSQFFTSKFATPSLIEAHQAFIEELSKACSLLSCLIDNLSSHLLDPYKELHSGRLLELQAIVSKLSKNLEFLHCFLEERENDRFVFWLEKNPQKAMSSAIHLSRLDVASILQENLYKRFRSTIFISATLSTQNNFSFIKKSLGVPSYIETNQKILSSPFDYLNQSLLLCPFDLPSPNSPLFSSLSKDFIVECLKASEGNAFILFTSYKMMQALADLISDEIEKLGMEVFIQGQMPRTPLLEEFKKSEKGVLFGTDTFWEGVDVVGDSLKQVIITKLPFRVPSDPLFEAQSEALEKEGKSPFVHDSLPRAIVKFKQGFGRLIRSRSDRGCVVCLDNRLVSKGYGKSFVQSLPQISSYAGKKEEVLQKLRYFYRQG